MELSYLRSTSFNLAAQRQTQLDTSLPAITFQFMHAMLCYDFALKSEVLILS